MEKTSDYSIYFVEMAFSISEGYIPYLTDSTCLPTTYGDLQDISSAFIPECDNTPINNPWLLQTDKGVVIVENPPVSEFYLSTYDTVSYIILVLHEDAEGKYRYLYFFGYKDEEGRETFYNRVENIFANVSRIIKNHNRC